MNRLLRAPRGRVTSRQLRHLPGLRRRLVGSNGLSHDHNAPGSGGGVGVRWLHVTPTRPVPRPSLISHHHHRRRSDATAAATTLDAAAPTVAGAAAVAPRVRLSTGAAAVMKSTNDHDDDHRHTSPTTTTISSDLKQPSTASSSTAAAAAPSISPAAAAAAQRPPRRRAAATSAASNDAQAPAAVAPIPACKPAAAVSPLPWSQLQQWVNAFDPAVPVSRAHTAPASWYTEPALARDLDARAIFGREWVHVGRTDQVPNVGDYFTGRVAGEPYLVVRDETGTIRAQYNVCRHHAARLTKDECSAGNASGGTFVCPYHGWTYALNGRLTKATKMTGVEQLRAATIRLTPIAVQVMGPFIFLRFSQEPDTTNHWASLKPLVQHLEGTGYERLQFLKRVTYRVKSNWKVFVDNYLDGGLHVPYAHKGLASLIEDGTYKIDVHERYSIQSASGKPATSSASDATATPSTPPAATATAAAAAAAPTAAAATKDGGGEVSDRLGDSATYAFVYPNFLLNRYGAWMDTNTVYPSPDPAHAHDECVVVFDYFVDQQLLAATHGPEAAARAAAASAGGNDAEHHFESEAAYVERCLAASDVVQREDMVLCESVQSGLQSSAYHTGRYAPAFEHPMHQFHRLLHASYTATIAAATTTTTTANANGAEATTTASASPSVPTPAL